MKRLLCLSIMAALLLGAFAASYDFEYDGLYYKFNSAYTEVTLVKGTKVYSGNITIPSEVPYLHITVPVKNINYDAFYGAQNIDTITFSEGVPCKNVQNCSVKKIVLMGNNNGIGIDKFTCKQLKELEFRGAVTSGYIHSSANYLSGPTADYLRIGPNVPICSGVRKYRPRIGYIIDPGNPWYRCENGFLIATEDGIRTLLAVEGRRNGDLVVPDYIDEIADSSFWCHTAKSVVMSTELRELRNVFSNCNIGTLDLSRTRITEVPRMAFFDDNYDNYDSEEIFHPKIKTLILPKTVTSIGAGAFCYCKTLETINVPSGVNYIGGSAFYGCTNLKSINLPAGLECFYSNLFTGCKSLQSVTIPSGIKMIPDNTFKGCTSLAEIKFDECSQLDTIGNSAFLECPVTHLDLPSTLRTIGDCAFAGNALEKVVIPSNVDSVGNAAFACGANLKELVIEDGTKMLKLGMLQPDYYDLLIGTGIWDRVKLAARTKLNRIEIGRNIIYMGYVTNGWNYHEGSYCLDYSDACGGVADQELTQTPEEIIIGEGVTDLTGFKSPCKIVPAVKSLNPIPPAAAEHNFDATTYNFGKLYVPKGSVEAYRAAAVWQNFSGIEELDESGLPPVVAGDVNGDRQVTTADVTAIYDILTGGSSEFISGADTNGDGQVTVSDVTTVYNAILGAE